MDESILIWEGRGGAKASSVAVGNIIASQSLIMDDLSQFSLHHGAKRLTMIARDVSRDRLEAIFKVS